MKDIIKIKDGESIDFRLEEDSILSNGYGFSPKFVMRMPDIPAQSKAIYAYLTSFAGNKGICFPTVKTMYYELDMSRDTFRKYMKVLKERGLIRVYRIQNEDNLYANNVYEIAMSKEKINQNAKDYKESKKSPEEITVSTSDQEKIKLNDESILTQDDKDIQVLKLNGFTEIEIYSMSKEDKEKVLELLNKLN